MYKTLSEAADYTGFTINAGDGPDYFEFHSGVNGYSLLNSVPTEFSPGEYVLSGSYIVTSNYIPELYEGLYPHIDPTLSASYVDDAQAPESPSVLTFTGEGSNGQPVELSIHFDPDSPDFVTTEPAPIRVLGPTIMEPKTFAPAPTTTFSINVGCLFP